MSHTSHFRAINPTCDEKAYNSYQERIPCVRLNGEGEYHNENLHPSCCGKLCSTFAKSVGLPNRASKSLIWNSAVSQDNSFQTPNMQKKQKNCFLGEDQMFDSLTLQDFCIFSISLFGRYCLVTLSDCITSRGLNSIGPKTSQKKNLLYTR